MTLAERTDEPLWVAFGGGRNSWALVIGLFRRGIRPDMIAFADTRGEKPETYRLICWVIKSACFFCPSSKPTEVVWLKENHPSLSDRALTMESRALAAGKLTHVKGLGRHWSWADVLKADRDQLKMFPAAVSVPCVCFDGEDE